MKIVDIVRSLLPHGTDGRAFKRVEGGEYLPARNNVELCPIWPPDIFAVTGTVIERSGCYATVGGNGTDLERRRAYLVELYSTVATWTQSYKNLFAVPPAMQERWTRLIDMFGDVDIGDVGELPQLVDDLVFMFSAADEACKGIGWDTPSARQNPFVQMALASFVRDSSLTRDVPTLPEAPHSLCALVPPSAAVVMPKTLTATVGCTIRSLSHHLALLPGASQCKTIWALATDTLFESKSRPIRLLVIPFPFDLPNDSFRVSCEPIQLTPGTKTAAFFGLEATWLRSRGKPITAAQLYNQLIYPLLKQANDDPRGGGVVTGVILPECALTDSVADAVAKRLAKTGVSFFTTGVLRRDRRTQQSRNVAKTYVLHKRKAPYVLVQYKHHRWRLDREQCDSYGLDFQWGSVAEKWWEDIDVSQRHLPIFAFRDSMSMTVLICEDLARNDPAMALVRAVGPNLVIALLMDGPQLNGRWPGKYATVLGEDPGSGVLSVTCAALVDRSNENWSGAKRRVIALWRSEGTAGKEIELPEGHHAVVLNVNSRKVEQHTLDTRADDFGSRKLSLGPRKALKLAAIPSWL